MKVVFLSGPYRSATEYGVYSNIHRASEWALEVWRRGAACVCPQKNTAFFGGAADDSLWLRGDIEILRRCDAVFAAPGWEASEGAVMEVETAQREGIPVFETLAQLETWLLERVA